MLMILDELFPQRQASQADNHDTLFWCVVMNRLHGFGLSEATTKSAESLTRPQHGNGWTNPAL
jgi:hypothetical protein